MQKEAKASLELAYIVSVAILVGMFLPWTKGPSSVLGVATMRGWHISWLPITTVIALGCYIAAYRNPGEKKWLWGALGFSIISLIVILNFGIDIFFFTEDHELSNVIPLIRFWLFNLPAMKRTNEYLSIPGFLIGFWFNLIGFSIVIEMVTRDIVSILKPTK